MTDQPTPWSSGVVAPGNYEATTGDQPTPRAPELRAEVERLRLEADAPRETSGLGGWTLRDQIAWGVGYTEAGDHIIAALDCDDSDDETQPTPRAPEHRPRNASGRCLCGEWDCPRMETTPRAPEPDDRPDYVRYHEELSALPELSRPSWFRIRHQDGECSLCPSPEPSAPDSGEGDAKPTGNSPVLDDLREQIAEAIARSEGLGLTRAQHPIAWAQVDHTAAAVMDVLRREGMVP